jgi:hypothetical protein
VTSVAKREMRSMQAAGWTVVEYGPWERLRALFGRRRPVGRVVASEAEVEAEVEVEVAARLHLPRPVPGWSR